jgi:hypothetical protein
MMRIVVHLTHICFQFVLAIINDDHRCTTNCTHHLEGAMNNYIFTVEVNKQFQLLLLCIGRASHTNKDNVCMNNGNEADMTCTNE